LSEGDKDEKLGLKNALELAISFLRKYALEDEKAGMNGYGCFENPKETVREWIEQIKEAMKETEERDVNENEYP